MSVKLYTAEQALEASRLYALIQKVPQDKLAIAIMMAEAFINGMTMQERLAAQANVPSSA